MSTLLAALLIGLTSSAHCIFMCGGIAASFGAHKESGQPAWLIHTLFHLGRLVSYAFIGLMLGFMVSSLSELLNLGTVLRLLAGLLLIAMGLYLANIWRGLAHLERAMAPVWQPIAGRLKTRLPARKPQDAFIVGLCWGWLPCGLVYSTLAWAATADNSLQTAALMFAMGIGSLPALVGISVLGQFIRHRWANRIAGLALCLFGLWTLVTPVMSLVSPTSHDHHGGHEHHMH